MCADVMHISAWRDIWHRTECSAPRPPPSSHPGDATCLQGLSLKMDCAVYAFIPNRDHKIAPPSQTQSKLVQNSVLQYLSTRMKDSS